MIILLNLKGALPAISVVPADIPDRERENEKKDPLLEFFEPIEQDKTSKPQSRASSECPKDTCHKVATPAAPALKEIKKPSITVTDTSETSQGLNLFKTDPELQLTQSESVSEPPSSDTSATLNQTSDLIDTEVSSSQLKHDVDSSTQAEALGDLEKQDKVIDVVSSIQPAQQPPAIYDIVPGVSRSGRYRIFSIVSAWQNILEVEAYLRLKAHPNVPNANLSNLNDFPNSDVPGLV